jgi:hypothetical protein
MRRAEPVAGLGGILLLVSLFLPWYEPRLSDAEWLHSFEPGGFQAVQGQLALTSTSAITAWRTFTVIDVLLAALALVAIAVPLVALLARGPAKPVAIAVVASALGWLAVLLVGFRIVDSPADYLQPVMGAWLALAGALIAWVGSWLSLRDESTPGAVAPEIPRRPAPATG